MPRLRPGATFAFHAEDDPQPRSRSSSRITLPGTFGEPFGPHDGGHGIERDACIPLPHT